MKSYQRIVSEITDNHEFKRGRDDVKYEPRSGRQVTETTEENVETVYQVRGAWILYDHLCMSKVCARWVPKMLTPDMKLIVSRIADQI